MFTLLLAFPQLLRNHHGEVGGAGVVVVDCWGVGGLVGGVDWSGGERVGGGWGGGGSILDRLEPSFTFGDQKLLMAVTFLIY